MLSFFFFFQAEDGIRDLVRSRGLGDVYKRQEQGERQQALFDRATGVEAMRNASREAVAQEQAAAKIQEAQAKAQEAEQSQQRKYIADLVNRGYADAIEPSVIKRTYGQGFDLALLAELQRAARDQKNARKNAQQVIYDYLLLSLIHL